MKEENLKRCPFCGGEAGINVNAQTLNARAFCGRCAVVMKRNFKGAKKIETLLEQMMTEEWNKRKIIPENTLSFDLTQH